MKILSSIFFTTLFVFTSVFANDEPTKTPARIVVRVVSEKFPMSTIGKNKVIVEKTVTINTSVDTPVHQRFGLKELTEFIFPVQFDPAAKSGEKAIPIAPKHFETKYIGWSIEGNPAELVKGFNGETLISVSGHADFVQFRGWLNDHAIGESSDEIFAKNGDKLTSNICRTPIIETMSTYFQLFAKPGKTYDIKAKTDLQHSVILHVICDFEKH